MKKALFLLVAVSLTLSGSLIAGDAITVHVSDSNCGAKHADHSAGSVQCVKTCVGNGAGTVLVDKDGNVHDVANPEAVAGHLGHQVSLEITKQDDGKVMVKDGSVKHVAP